MDALVVLKVVPRPAPNANPVCYFYAIWVIVVKNTFLEIDPQKVCVAFGAHPPPVVFQAVGHLVGVDFAFLILGQSKICFALLTSVDGVKEDAVVQHSLLADSPV